MIAPSSSDAGTPDTFPKLLLEHARLRAAVHQHSRKRSRHLAIVDLEPGRRGGPRAWRAVWPRMGFKRGDNLAIIGDNRPRLYWAMAAAQCLGGVPVPLYQDAVAERDGLHPGQRGRALRDRRRSGAGRQAARDQGPTAASSSRSSTKIRAACATTRSRFCMPTREVQQRGRDFDAAQPDFFLHEVEQGRGRRRRHHALHLRHDRQAEGRVSDPCSAASPPHAAAASSTSLGPGDEILSYLPMAWVGDNLFSYAQALVAGLHRQLPGVERYGDDRHARDRSRPTISRPPRVFENLLTQVMIRMEDAARLKRALFHYFLDVARRCGAEILDRQTRRVR